MSRMANTVRDDGTAASLPWPIELEPAAVRARLRQARRRGRPRYLWPEVEPAAWREALRTIERATRQILMGLPAALNDSNARALGIAAFTSGMGPLLGWWIERGQLEAAEPARTLLLLHLDHGRRRARVQRGILSIATTALHARGIEPLVLKSAATGPLYFPEPGTRPGVDIDLVVGPDEFERAEAALAATGHQQVGRQASPRKSDWRVPGRNPWPRSIELLHSDAQYGIDLHASLERDFFGIRRVTIEADTMHADVVDGTIRVLSQPALLAFHALHASEGLDNLTLVRLVEIVFMIRRDGGRTLDWEALLDTLRRSGGDRFAWPAFALAERLAPSSIDSAVLRSLERASTPAMRRVVSGLGPADAQRLDVLTLRERFMWCAGPGDHVRRVAHMLVPSPARRSPLRLASLYADRGWRLLRGTVEVKRNAPRDSRP